MIGTRPESGFSILSILSTSRIAYRGAIQVDARFRTQMPELRKYQYSPFPSGAVMGEGGWFNRVLSVSLPGLRGAFLSSFQECTRGGKRGRTAGQDCKGNARRAETVGYSAEKPDHPVVWNWIGSFLSIRNLRYPASTIPVSRSPIAWAFYSFYFLR
jgi:hypothetical protein